MVQEMSAGSTVIVGHESLETFYVSNLKGGALKPSINLTIERETVATALLDGPDGIGQVIAFRAMQAGVSCVTVRNSNHFGAAAYYPMMALEAGMIGIVLSNASPLPAKVAVELRTIANDLSVPSDF